MFDMLAWLCNALWDICWYSHKWSSERHEKYHYKPHISLRSIISFSLQKKKKHFKNRKKAEYLTHHSKTEDAGETNNFNNVISHTPCVSCLVWLRYFFIFGATKLVVLNERGGSLHEWPQNEEMYPPRDFPSCESVRHWLILRRGRDIISFLWA